MRIGIDAHSAERDGTGNCTYTRNLILALADYDRENLLILFVTDAEHPFYKSLLGKPNLAIVPIRRSPAWLRVFYWLPQAARRENVDLLHVQYFAPLGRRLPVVNMIHDVAWMRFPQFFSFLERTFLGLLVPGSARRARYVLTTSGVSKNDLVQLLNLPSEKVKVTHNGVSASFSRDAMDGARSQQVCAEYGLKRKFLLYVGRIDPRKNLVRLIDAYTLLRTKYAMDYQFAIAGKIHLEPQAMRATLLRSEYREDIRFCGYVSDEDLPLLYRAADIFVYASEFEGFGLPPLEAMACGTPVVASDIAIFREILSDAAVLVNPLDVHALAGGIHKIFSDPALREDLIRKGKLRAKEFTWENTAKKTLAVFRDAMNPAV